MILITRSLAVFISQLEVEDKLFENLLNTLTFVADKSYGSLDEPVDRDL